MTAGYTAFAAPLGQPAAHGGVGEIRPGPRGVPSGGGAGHASFFFPRSLSLFSSFPLVLFSLFSSSFFFWFSVLPLSCDVQEASKPTDCIRVSTAPTRPADRRSAGEPIYGQMDDRFASRAAASRPISPSVGLGGPVENQTRAVGHHYTCIPRYMADTQ